MSCEIGKNNVTDSLMLFVDASNSKSYGNVNIIQNSTYNNLNWTSLTVVGQPSAGATITPNIIAPDGTNTAVRISSVPAVVSLVRINHQPYNPIANTYYCVSFYVRYISGNFGNLISDWYDTGAYVYNQDLILGEWVRVSYPVFVTNTLTRVFSDIISDTYSNYVLDFWGLQINAGYSPTRYTPTNGTQLKSSINSWYDLSGNQNHATTNDTPTFTKILGDTVFSFDGTNSFLIPDTLYPDSIYNTVSIETVLSIPSSANWGNGNTGNIISRGSYTGSLGLVRNVTTNTIAMWCRSNTSFNQANFVINRNTIYHCVGTWDGVLLKLYINGNLKSSVSLASIDATDTFKSQFWDIGGVNAFSGSDGTGFQGSISYVKVYSKDLTPLEIKQNFNSIKGAFNLT